VSWAVTAAIGFFAVIPPVAVLVWALRLWGRARAPRSLTAMAGLLASAAVVAIVAAIVLVVFTETALYRGDLDLVDKAKILAAGIYETTNLTLAANVLAAFAALELAILSWKYRRRSN